MRVSYSRLERSEHVRKVCVVLVVRTHTFKRLLKANPKKASYGEMIITLD